MHNPSTTTYKCEKSQQAIKFWQVASAKTLWQPFTYEHKNNQQFEMQQKKTLCKQRFRSVMLIDGEEMFLNPTGAVITIENRLSTPLPNLKVWKQFQFPMINSNLPSHAKFQPSTNDHIVIYMM